MIANKLSFATVFLVFAVPIITSIILRYLTPPIDHGTGSMFDLIASRYDFINRVLSLNLDTGWRRTLVKEVTSNGDIFKRQKEKIQILDLATGTADLAILLAKQYELVAPTDVRASILGVDPSQKMITIGREKIDALDLSNIVTLELGDARNLTKLDDDFFHVATMSFGIRNVPEKEQVLCEIHRVLHKKQGQMAILEFSEPTEEAGIMGVFARFFIRYIVPIIGAFLSGSPTEYIHLQNSIKDFPPPKEFVRIIEGITCGERGVGSFKVNVSKSLNFGSVHLYIATPVIVE